MRFAIAIVGVVWCTSMVRAGEERRFSIQRNDSSITIKADDQPAVVYQLKRPENPKYPLESACYFHPLRSPSGKILTDFANADHPHHRGIFMGWVEMHGKKDADFWGWGQPAPIVNRKIVNRSVGETRSDRDGATFAASNVWLAEGETLLREELAARFHTAPKCNVLDLTYRLTADADLTLAKWAFSGFCVRMSKEGKLTIDGPVGVERLTTPIHTKPESDWPAAKWYGFTLSFGDGTSAGIAVINHPKNPATLWHNQKDIRMINPAITAPGAVVIKAGEPLVLRYRVVAHDGPAERVVLDRLAEEFGAEAK
jgi:methane monooxygenase PmoA-like